MIFEHTIATITASLLCLSALRGDQLELRGPNGQHLTGRVASIDESGIVELISPVSRLPLRLKPDAVTRITLDTSRDDAPSADTVLTLANGDRMPLTVRSFDPGKGLTATATPFGDASLPPHVLDSLEFGVNKRSILFSGPGEPSTWKSPANQRTGQQVSVEDGAWRIAGSAEFERRIPFPKDFILSFRMKWEPNSQPNLRFFIASPGNGRMERANRYLLQFGAAGFEVKRESGDGQRWLSVLVCNRPPTDFPSREIDAELHVSRSTNTLILFLNGEKEALGVDPLKLTPDGDGLILSFTGTPASAQSLASLSVQELHHMRVRHSAEDRGDIALDGLISRDEDRWSGTLRDIRRDGKGLRILFDSPIGKEPIELPSEHASTVFFRRAKAGQALEKAIFRLQLRSEGHLSVLSCRIAQDNILAQHPLLGALTIDKSQVLGIERIMDPPPAPPKGEP